MDDYLNRIDEHLRSRGVNSIDRGEMLAELKSHLVERLAEFRAEGSDDPLGLTLTAFGDPETIASDFAATMNLRAASRTFLPGRLLAAAWSLARQFGYGIRLFAIGIFGYSLSFASLLAAVMKVVLPDRVGFWIGGHGVIWGLKPAGGFDREMAGGWFIPISIWITILFAVGTTFLLRNQLRSFLAQRKGR